MWTSNIESIVFSKIKYYVESKLKAKYPGLNLTTSSVRPVNPTFPTVYIHEMPGIETANDMESKVINSVSCTFQIEVTDANSEIIAKEVMNAIVDRMKGLMFSVTSFPEFQNTDGYFRNVARFSRIIGKDDIL